jgi:hypothetical protein
LNLLSTTTTFVADDVTDAVAAVVAVDAAVVAVVVAVTAAIAIAIAYLNSFSQQTQPATRIFDESIELVGSFAVLETPIQTTFSGGETFSSNFFSKSNRIS